MTYLSGHAEGMSFILLLLVSSVEVMMLFHPNVVIVVHVFIVWRDTVPIVLDGLDEVAEDRGIRVYVDPEKVLWRCHWERGIHRNEYPHIHL